MECCDEIYFLGKLLYLWFEECIGIGNKSRRSLRRLNNQVSELQTTLSNLRILARKVK